MWRPAGFNENRPSAFDYANLGRTDIGAMTSMADDGRSLLRQTGYKQEANLGRKGLRGLASGLRQLDDARVDATRQQNASQAGLVSGIGGAASGLVSAGITKFGNPTGGFGSNLSGAEQGLIIGASNNMFNNLFSQ